MDTLCPRGKLMIDLVMEKHTTNKNSAVNFKDVVETSCNSMEIDKNLAETNLEMNPFIGEEEGSVFNDADSDVVYDTDTEIVLPIIKISKISSSTSFDNTSKKTYELPVGAVNGYNSSDSDLDDTDVDETWEPTVAELNAADDDSSDSHNNLVDGLTVSETNASDKPEESQDVCKRGKKRLLNKDGWKRNVNKRLRNSGKGYVNAKGNLVPSRSLGPVCGDKCSMKCKDKLSEEDRLKLFNQFWEIGDLTKQRYYLKNCMNQIEPAHRYPKGSRKLNSAFYFHVDLNKIRVCKKMFMQTLGIGDRFVRNAIAKCKDSSVIIEDDLRGKHRNHKTVSEDIKNDIRKHINSFPRVESHYLRAQTSREYIDGGLSISTMYKMYKELHESEGRNVGNLTLYSKIFNLEFNIGFFVPKKDQCSICTAYTTCDTTDDSLKENYENHMKLKNDSRKEKEKDALKAKQGNIVMACYDLQAVLPSPCGEVSLFYYKRRLSSYNFTIYNVGLSKGYCYFWSESVAHRGSNEIGTCVMQFLSDHCQSKDVVFYSDNCIGQNKNKSIVAMYLYCALHYNIPSITHKYFAVGHGQNEGDSMHSTIEKQKKRALKSGPIYIPAQWVTIIQTAKKSGHPYSVKELETNIIKDLKDLSVQLGSNYTSDENGNKVRWNDIRIIKVVKELLYSFQYKYSYDESEPFKTVSIRRTTRGSNPILKNAFVNAPKIGAEKKKDLVSLCEANVIPKSYHSYFYNLN